MTAFLLAALLTGAAAPESLPSPLPVPFMPTPAVASARAVGVSSARNGDIVGVVTDTTGAPLGNVQVVASGVNRVALTNDRGEFAFRDLPAGSYHLDVIRIGYLSVHEVIVLPASGSARVTIVMHVATVRLTSINVTATPTGSDPLNVTQATVQLSGKELQRALSSSIGSTLAREPGMAARFNGPAASTPVIRGLTGERVLVLQDGDRAGDLSSAAADHMNAVDPTSAERIEVIRGPASLLYGNNAIGGVVNVISQDIPTTIPSRMTGSLLGQGESVTPGGVVGAGITMPLTSRLAFTARGLARDGGDMRVGGGGTQPNTAASTQQFVLGSGYVGPKASVGVVYRQMNFAYGLPHDDGDEAIQLDGVRRSVALQSSITTGWAVLPSIRIDQTVQRYRHEEIEEDGAVGTRFRLNTQTTNITARTHVGRATGALGVQGLFRQYAPVGEEAFTPAADNDNVAVFAYQELPLTQGGHDGHAPLLQLGARYDRFAITTRPGAESERFGMSQSRTFENMAASAGLSIPLTHSVSLTANASRGFRAPAVEELYADGFHAAAGTYDIGNAQLEPERSTSLEAGLRAQGAGLFAQLAAYRNVINGYIAPVQMAFPALQGEPVPPYPVVSFTGRDAVMWGAEGQVEGKVMPRVVGGLMGDYVRATVRGSNESLPFIPAGRLGASLRYDNGRLSAGGEVRRVFAQSRVSGDAFDVPTDAYTQLDLSATYLFTVQGRQVHSVTLRVDNAADARYRDATSRIKRFAYNPGRNLSLVYRLLF